MKRAYVITGELENGTVAVYYAVCHSIEKAEQLCFQAEDEDSDANHVYTWHEIIEEEDD